jgi:hypothetical protein
VSETELGPPSLPAKLVAIAEPHAVGRCVPGETRSCLPHPGDELNADGLCSDGRAVYDAAVTELAGRGGSPARREGDLLDALLRAQRRRSGWPAALRLALAAIAAVDPEAARALTHVSGAPLDLAPKLVEKLARGAGLSRLLAAVDSAVERGFESFVDGISGEWRDLHNRGSAR